MNSLALKLAEVSLYLLSEISIIITTMAAVKLPHSCVI